MRTAPLIVLTVLGLFGNICPAQETEQGLRPYGPYVKSSVAAVNLQNGNLYGQIPLATYPQKGRLSPLSLFLTFNTTTFEQVETCPPLTGECFTYYLTSSEVSGGDPPGVHLGYTYFGERVSESHLKLTSLILDPHGLAGSADTWEHAHYLTDHTGHQHTMVLSVDRTRYDAADGSGYAEILSFPLGTTRYGTPPTSTIRNPDGTVIDLAGRATDVLGNTIQWVTRTAPSGPLAGQQERLLVDSAGREFHTYPGDIQLCPNLGQPGQSPYRADELVTPGSNGSTISYLLCTLSVGYHTNFLGFSADNWDDAGDWPWRMWDPLCYDPDNCGLITTAVNSLGGFDAIQSVVLPDASGHVSSQSKYWGFIYDSSVPAQNSQGHTYSSESYGTVSKIIYPTGALDTMNYASANIQSGIVNQYGAMPPAYRSVTSLVSDDGVGHQQSQTFDYAGLHDPFSQGWTHVQDGLGNVTEHILGAGGVSGRFDAGNAPLYETDTIVHDGGMLGPVIRNTQTAYIVEPTCSSAIYTLGSYCSVRPSTTSVYNNGVLVSSTSYTYPTLSTGIDLIYNGYLVYVDTMEAPFRIPFGEPETITTTGSDGLVLRTDVTRYRFLDDSATKQANMLNLVSTQSVLDQSGATASSTVMGYDEPGSPQGTFGNPTSVHRHLANGAEIVSRQIFNGDGRPTLSIDGDNNQTLIAYECQGMYPSSVTRAYGSLTTVPETVVYTHDCVTGDITQKTDPNGITSSFFYNDVLGRPTGMIRAVGVAGMESRTVITYPSLTAVEIRSDEKITGDGLLLKNVAYDGFGREISQQLPNGAYVKTEYDANGRLHSRSNSFMANEVPSKVVTSYDALGRPTVQTNQDGTQRHWTYMGVETLTEDEAQKKVSTIVDGLSRLTDVSEDPLGANLHTHYTYNALNLLTGVQQAGTAGEVNRQRSFSYDMLGRLITSGNPETGTICYGTVSSGLPSNTNCNSDGYDANDNLLHKTDARGLATAYTYDALNRLKSKWRSGGSTDLYYYDGQVGQWAAPQFLGGNLIGRLSFTRSFNPDLSGPSCDINGAKKCDDQYFGYDAMGRQNWEVEAAPSLWGLGITLSQAGYDLAGHMTSLNYPSGRIINNTFDNAGRLQTVQQVGAGSPFISGMTYHPDGSPLSISYGDPANGVVETLTQNTRLQPCHTVAVRGTMNLMDRQAFYTPNMPSSPCGPEGNNNGNIWHIVDGLGLGPNSQDFTYDALNRLKSFSAPQLGGMVRQQNYDYDSFGNIAATKAYSTSTPNNTGTPMARMFANVHFNDPATTWPYDANNRLIDATFDCSGPGGTGHYDAAGNVLCGGSNTDLDAKQYTWDAESRMTKVGAQHNGNTYDFAALYTYDAGGSRIRSDLSDPANTSVPAKWREYSFFNGQMLSEKDQAGNWTDYIYANGRKIAKVDTAKPVLHLQGTRAGNWSCGVEGPVSGIPSGVVGYTIQGGDRLAVTMKQDVPTYGGLAFIFTNNTGTGAMADLATNVPFYVNSTSDGQWHSMVGDLTPYAGMVVSYVLAGIHQWAPDGAFDLEMTNAAIIHSDGSIQPVLTGQSASVPNFSGNGCGASNMSSGVTSTAVADPQVSTDYYLDDHLGTKQMELSAGGWPIWEGQFAPFGQELDNQTTAMRYKFTGKERDAESGLDYFGARYYASNMGRWMSPDWAAKAMPVPYAKLDNPQSLNLYGYVLNNPLSKIDADGHDLTVNGEKQKDYIAYAQKASGLTLAADKNGKISITASPKEMSALGKSFTKLINDTENHVSISAEGATTKAFIGQFDGNGHQTLNFQNINALDGKGGFSGAAAVTHETFEAYYSSQGMGFDAAHTGGLSYEATERTLEGAPARTSQDSMTSIPGGQHFTLGYSGTSVSGDYHTATGVIDNVTQQKVDQKP